jgi:5-hydroxyisourate hydrolase-like protein (transthyretin family)
MRGFLLAIVGLVLALASIAQVPAPQSGKTSEKLLPANCAVSGQVVTAADGAPLKSSRVALIQQDASSHPQAFSATTDSEGRFEIKRVTPGRYNLFATHTGYISQQYQSRGMNGGTALTLVPGQEVDGALFRLVRGAVITGRIVDESGEPMAKIGVTALRKAGAAEMAEMAEWGHRARKEQLMSTATAHTDDRGEYRLFDLKPGEYYVKASESEAFQLGAEDGLSWITRSSLGSQYAPVFYPGVIQLDEAQLVPLAAGEEVRAEFAMRQVKTVEVAGRVLAADGRAASGAYVLLYTPEAFNWVDQLSANTNTKGEFVVKGVPSGSYVLTAQREEEGGRRLFTQQKLEVGNENIDSVLLAFSQGATVRGRIVAVGASTPERVQITFESSQESDMAGGGSALSKPDGSFQVNGVADGDYVLLVYDLEQGWYVRSARLGGEDVLEKGLQVEKGSVSGNLEIVLSSAAAQLEGAVTDHDKPAGGAQVWAKPEPETTYNRMRLKSATTDQNGRFTFRTLPPGKYRVIAKLASVSSEAPAAASEPKIVSLGEHEHQTLQLTLATPQSQ